MEPIKQTTLQPHPPREPVKPPRGKDPHAGFDRDRARRPGSSGFREAAPWPNARWPIEAQPKTVPIFMHGRPNKAFPPVFGTNVPPHGLAGRIRKLAYGYPDHMARHWLMLLVADRVDSWSTRAKKALPLAVPALFVGWVAGRMFRSEG